MIFESCPCPWKGEVELEEPTQSLSPPTKPEIQAEQKAEGGRAPACGSWRRWMLCVLPFFPFTAVIALTLHFLTCEYRPALADFSATSPVLLKWVYFDSCLQSHKCTILRPLPPPLQLRPPQCSSLVAAWSSQT